MNFHLNDTSTQGDEAMNMMEWIKTNYLDEKEADYNLRMYVFQCNNLPPSDSNGLADP